MTLSTDIADLAPVEIDLGSGAVVLPVGDLQVPLGILARSVRNAGRKFNSQVFVPGGAPGVAFPMPGRLALDTFGLEPVRFDTCKVYLQTYADSLRNTGATNKSISFANGGMVYVQSLSVQQNGILQAQVMVMPFSSDGQAEPFTIEDNETIPSISTEPIHNTMGPVTINSTVIPGAAGINVDLGQQVAPQVHSGQRYPKDATYRGGNPSITVEDAALLDAITRLDLIAKKLPTAFYFREYDEANVDLKTTGISLVAAASVIVPQAANLPNDAHGSQSVTITPLSSDGDHPLVYTASGAIP